MDPNLSLSGTETIRFGSFCLIPVDRKLLENGKPVPLGSRAIEILMLLVERAGQFVGNDEIFERVWPRTVVVQGNLRVHLAGLRKALGDGRDGQRYIVNVPNRGYSFVQRVVRETAREVQLPAPAAAPVARLPTPLNRVIGQGLAMQALVGQLRQHRLVTLVGAGGIGKTTIALTAAALAFQEPKSPWTDVHFIDLSSLNDEHLVPSALAASLGLAALVSNATQNLLAYLQDKSLLIVFDNCEHLVSSVATLVEDILRGAQDVHLLATSREPLRAGGEWVQRVQALELPPSSAHIGAKAALLFPAIELFVERASAAMDTFVLTDADVPALIDICRRLDGIPLAIELAAARIDPLGIRAIAAGIDNCFALLSKGRRTALPRHQTLRATMEWSFGLLSAREQTVLLRLSVFAGNFPLDAATEVAGWGELSTGDVLDIVSDLVAKSLVTADLTSEDVMFRLLETTRSYAAMCLAAQAAASAMRQRHAEHCVDLLGRAEAAWKTTPVADWLRRYGGRIDDVRAALHWAFSEGGDLPLGVAITAGAATLFFQLSFVEELRQRAEHALAAMSKAGFINLRREFELCIVYGHALFNTQGLQPESATSFARALSIAQELGDDTLLALSYSTNWMGAYNRGQPRQMLAFARQFEETTAAKTDEALKLMYDRMYAPALHFDGDQHGARACAERGLAATRVVRAPFFSGSQIDRRVSLLTILGRVLWVQGFLDQAEVAITESIHVAALDGQSVALAFALGFCACPLAIATGKMDLARERVDALIRHTREHSLSGWLEWGRAYESLLQWHEQGASGVPPMPANAVAWAPQLVEMMAVLHPVYVGEAVLGRADAGHAGWCTSEIRRVSAEQLHTSDPANARKRLREAMAQSQRDGAGTWELRIATTLARIDASNKRAQEAVILLGEVLGRVTEGFAAPDVRAAVEAYRAAARITGTKNLRQFPHA